jgi:hypothetical protein
MLSKEEHSFMDTYIEIEKHLQNADSVSTYIIVEPINDFITNSKPMA